jgi:hypothetical protein
VMRGLHACTCAAAYIMLDPQNDVHRCTIILSLPSQLETDVLAHDILDMVRRSRELWQRLRCILLQHCRADGCMQSICQCYRSGIRISSDILRSRMRTTGITETTFSNMPYMCLSYPFEDDRDCNDAASLHRRPNYIYRPVGSKIGTVTVHDQWYSSRHPIDSGVNLESNQDICAFVSG